MIYKCSICGYVHDEEKTGIKLKDLKHCPVCKQPIEKFNEEKEVKKAGEKSNKSEELYYDHGDARSDKTNRYMDTIHQIAVSGESVVASMATTMPMPNWDDILIMGCQLNPKPLDYDAEVNTETVIGKKAKKPMVLQSPVYISHMSFGALSRESKIALAKGSALAKTAMCSGEGGILKEEMDASYKYIFEYVPNKYSVTDENLQNSDAIDIKIGQGTKPGLGGQLPGNKVTAEIAEIRGHSEGESIHAPASFPWVNSKEDLKDLVDELRETSKGRPIGIKIAAGRIEDDLEHVLYADPDFVTLDGRGGGTGASPLLVRESTSVPTVYALHRARKYLDEHESDIDLVITGGLRVSSDFTKALAMGADAIAIATAAIIAASCQQYRICGTGECPVGIATQKEDLRERFKIDKSSWRVANFLNQSLNEIKEFARMTHHSDVHDFTVDDLATFNREISDYTNIKHV